MFSKSSVHVDPADNIGNDKGQKSRRWLSPTYNLTVSVIWSPFLVKANIFEDNDGVSTADIELHLDKLDTNWTDIYHSLASIIFASGEWFLRTALYYENGEILGCHYCPKRNLTELGFKFAYRKVFRKVFDFIFESNHKGTIFYRTTAPDHFENGFWNNGGNCKRTEPVKEGGFELRVLNQIIRDVELEEFEKASVRASEKGVNLKLFDVLNLSLLRPEGHPGPYRHVKIITDCLHWCLPGPIDSWNDLLMEMVANG